jgi:septal ring factor EnvC (AmiA/AmiB activator)
MEQLVISLSIGFVFGVAFASIAAWVITRKSGELAASRARGETQVEVAKLNERLASTEKENAELRRRIDMAQTTIFDLQHQAQVLSDERARLEERTSQVPGLEEKLRLM